MSITKLTTATTPSEAPSWSVATIEGWGGEHYQCKPRRQAEPTSGIIPEYYAKALDGMAEAVTKAAGSLKKVTLKVGETKTGGKGFIRDSREPTQAWVPLHTISCCGEESELLRC